MTAGGVWATHAGPPPSAGTAATAASGSSRAGYGSALALTVTLVVGAVLALMALALAVVHPDDSRLSVQAAALVNQQNQTVKTDLYLAAFLVILPLALIAAPRLADRIASGANGAGLPSLVAALVGLLAAALIMIRFSGGLPWGDGVTGVLIATGGWLLVAAGAIARAAGDRRWPLLSTLAQSAPAPQFCAAVLVFGTLLCLTSRRSLGVVPLAIGTLVAVAVLFGSERVRWPRPRRAYRMVDVALVVILIIAIPDVIVFKTTSALPSVFFDPGVVQFQHDWILGSANQLLGGGALLVNVPVSQYGVGLIYFLYGWFHLVPIGYGTFGFLDGLLTALFYVAAYAVLRLAGVHRLLAGSALVLAVLAFVYNFSFFVGQLPEEGPLRFGLPMIVVAGSVAAARRPDRATIARLLSLTALGVSAIWSVEAFAYTTFTFGAVAVVGAWLEPAGQRRRRLVRAALAGIAACVAAQLVLALATLQGTGSLPHWHQYLGYVHEFLFGEAGSITYGFADWSPGLAVYVAALASAAAIVLLIIRRPTLARRDPAWLIALTGATAYAIALLSYTDNRSSTYLFLYVALPVLMAGVLWLSLTRDSELDLSAALRRSALAAALAVAVLLFSGAWPAIGEHFSRSALAHARPGGGLRAALTRLWHPPPIDPRAPAGERLLDRFMPAHHDLILLPTLSDLGLEILMRSHRANALPIGDPKADSLVPEVWLPIMRRAVPRLRAGERILIDLTALRVIAALRDPAVNPTTSRIDGAQPEVAWILHQLDLRFRIHVIDTDPTGLIVAQLGRR